MTSNNAALSYTAGVKAGKANASFNDTWTEFKAAHREGYEHGQRQFTNTVLDRAAWREHFKGYTDTTKTDAYRVKSVIRRLTADLAAWVREWDAFATINDIRVKG